MINLDQNSVKYDSTNLSDIQEKLFYEGFVQIQFFFDQKSPIKSLENFFIEFIEKLGGKCLKHNEDKDSIVWHVRPIGNLFDVDEQGRQRARSQTDDEFPFHTDCSYETNPPEFMALFVIEEDQCGGGQLEIIRVADVLQSLSRETREYLLNENLRIEIPSEFRQSADIDHIEGPILLDEERIRFRYDIISTGNREILDELNEKIQQVERYRPKLRKFSMILLNNQTYLHGRTKVLDSNRHLLRIRFDCPLPFDVFSVFDRTKLSREHLRFQNDFVDFLHDEHRQLYSILRLIVQQYDQPNSIGEEIRRTFQFDEKIDRLIKELNSVRTDYQLGFYRPDILFTHGEKFRINGKEFFQPKFCEINARFPFNGYFLTAGISPKTHRNLIEEILDQSKFDRNKSVFILKSKENGFDIHLFVQYWRNKCQQTCDFVDPKHLKIVNNNLIDEKTGQIIEQFLLELHQDEILQLDDEILHFLIHNERIRYFNDLRTIFLLHDKRLFTLLSNSTFLYALLGKSLSNSFIELFPRTWTIDRIPSFLKETIINNRQHWLIKPNSLGKGDNILIGVDLSIEQWKNELVDENHRQWIVQEYFPLIEYKSMKIVGNLICSNNRCFPLGFIRMSPTKIVNISHGGAFIRCSVPQRFECRTKDRTILTKSQLDKDLNERKSIDPHWNQNAYLSVSGGSGGKRLCFVSDIQENKRQREIFVRMLLKQDVINDQDICLNLFYSNRLYRSLELFDDFCSMANATSIPIGGNVDDETILQAIDEFQPNVLMGTSFRLIKFARFIQSKSERKLSFEKIFFGGESLDEIKRNYLREVFHCSTFLGFYGSAETGVYACQTKPLSSTRIYLYPKELVHVEIVDNQIIVTNRIRRRNQLIRFNTGDQGQLLSYPDDDRYGLIEVFHSERLFLLGPFELAKSHLEHIVQSLNFLEWQLIIDYLHDQTNRIRLLLRYCQSETNLSIDQVEKIILKGFQQRFNENFHEFPQFVKLEFESIRIDEFIRNETSNKLLRIIDRRL